MKKTLPILLLVPFAVSILTFISITPIKNLISVDISSISWDYLDSEGFKKGESYELEATPVYDENFTLADGNDLVWLSADEEVASISLNGGAYFITGLEEGVTTITCRNEKGSVSRSFTATVYEGGAITIVDASTPSSGDSFEKTRSYGEYDYAYDGGARKVAASIELSFGIYSDYEDDRAVFKSCSSNLSYADGKVAIKAPGQASITFALEKMPYIESTYSFEVVEDAVNVKSYDDLMQATNLSEEGEIVCLQRNLLSLSSTYQKDGNGNYVDSYLSNNTRLFGRYDFARKTTSFDIYSFQTTYPHDYLVDYYTAYPEEGSLEEALAVKSGIHVQKDFIGNGFSISTQELAYPYHAKYAQNGRLTPGKEDYFQGPLPYVFIGTPAFQVITAYGQDNSSMYVEGNDIEVSDLKLMSVDNLNDTYYLEWVGSTMDVLGENITVRDSYLRNGRTCLRVYSSPNFLLDNSYLSTSREFLLKVGSNELAYPSEYSFVSLPSGGGGALGDVLAKGGVGDAALEDAVTSGGAPIETSLADLKAIQEALDSTSRPEAWDMEVRDAYFEKSGLFSIALESVFNGPYLYSGAPSFVSDIVNMLQQLNLNVLTPTEIGGVSRPVNLTLSGDTRIYDYKDIQTIDASCLVNEQISALLSELGMGGDGQVSFPIDSYFPIKNLVEEGAKAKGQLYNDGDSSFVLGGIAFYGGGLNLSSVEPSGMERSPFGEEISVDYARSCITGQGLAEVEDEFVSKFSDYLARCVPLAAGANPFRFVLGEDTRSGNVPYLYGEVPDITLLKERGGK